MWDSAKRKFDPQKKKVDLAGRSPTSVSQHSTATTTIGKKTAHIFSRCTHFRDCTKKVPWTQPVIAGVLKQTVCNHVFLLQNSFLKKTLLANVKPF